MRRTAIARHFPQFAKDGSRRAYSASVVNAIYLAIRERGTVRFHRLEDNWLHIQVIEAADKAGLLDEICSSPGFSERSAPWSRPLPFGIISRTRNSTRPGNGSWSSCGLPKMRTTRSIRCIAFRPTSRLQKTTTETDRSVSRLWSVL